MNPYPQKKVLTFNKHTDDFSFSVKYADLEHIPANEVKYVYNFFPFFVMFRITQLLFFF